MVTANLFLGVKAELIPNDTKMAVTCTLKCHNPTRRDTHDLCAVNDETFNKCTTDVLPWNLPGSSGEGHEVAEVIHQRED